MFVIEVGAEAEVVVLREVGTNAEELTTTCCPTPDV